MSAKEMFEKLGYEKEENSRRIYWYSKHFISETNVISFRKTTKVLNNYIEYDSPFAPNAPLLLSIEELQAINKQVEELGWLNE